MCVQYIGGCLVHRGVFSTFRGVQYIEGIPWVHRGDIMSTSGDIMSTSGVFSTSEGYPWVHQGMFSTSEGCHEYIGGISWVHQGMFSTRGDIMIHVGGYHEYIGGCSVHWGMFSTSRGYHEYIGGYHEYIGGISWVHRGMFSTSEFSIEIERILSSCSPTCIVISLWCTEHPLVYSWYSPDVLMVSPHIHHDIPQCNEHPPMYSWYPPHSSWYPPNVLNIPLCTHDIPLMHWWYPPDVLNIPRCTEHTLYRVIMAYRQSYQLKWNLFMKPLTSDSCLKFFLIDLEDSNKETIEVELDLMAIIETTRAEINLMVIQVVPEIGLEIILGR